MSIVAHVGCLFLSGRRIEATQDRLEDWLRDQRLWRLPEAGTERENCGHFGGLFIGELGQ